MFNYTGEQLSMMLIAYGFVASVLPVWTLLAPRDYLSTFLKIGTIVGLALGIFIVLPDLKMPAVTKFIDGTGPVFAGSLFPFLFITIACGAISGFHSLDRIGHDAQDARQRDQRPPHRLRRDADGKLRRHHGVGRGLDARTGPLFRDEQSRRPLIGTTPETAAAAISSWGFAITPDMLKEAATNVGEATHSVPHRRRADARRRHGRNSFERRRRQER